MKASKEIPESVTIYTPGKGIEIVPIEKDTDSLTKKESTLKTTLYYMGFMTIFIVIGVILIFLIFLYQYYLHGGIS